MRFSKPLAAFAVLGTLWASPAQAVIQCAWMGDANYTASSTDICVLLGTPFTAPRTLTLPRAGATQLGQGAAAIRYADGLTIIDISNAVSALNTLTIAAPSGGTVGGAPNVLDTAGSFSIVYPISGSDWFLTAHGTEGPTGPAGGDLTGTYPNPTLAEIGSAAGPIGSATVAPIVSIDTKGRVTALTQATITPAIASITGLGTGVATALGTNVGSAGAPVLFNGAGGTPTSLVLTNATGLPLGSITGFGTGVATALAAAMNGSTGPIGTLTPTNNNCVIGNGTAWTSAACPSGSSTSTPTPQGRLTLQSGTPVMTTTQSAKTTIYYTPYLGSVVAIYDGTNWATTTFAEISVATTDTTKNPAAIGASKVNDWFIWNDSGTLRLTHGPDWTNDTTRSAGTALTRVNGIYLNSVAITNACAIERCTYVGTTRSNASSQLDYILGGSASGGTAGFLGVWNMYNRVSAFSFVGDNGASYTYSSATIRQARASAGNQVTFVTGLAEDAIEAKLLARQATAAATGANMQWGIGLDTTSAYTYQPAMVQSIASAVQNSGIPAPAIIGPQLGVHFISSNESSDGTNSNTFNVAGFNSLSILVRN